jgi:translation initiation factor eIF-2B subunit epsilon
MGDCLRKISKEKLINGDFILIRGLVITNLDLEKALNFHLKLKKEDPNRILTSILKTYKNDKDIKTKYDENFLIYDKSNNKILQYESTYDTGRVKLNENVKFKLKSVQLEKKDQYAANYYKIRTDLFDTFIDICTPELLDRFSENFDYQNIRDHIYKNLINSEIYTDTFYLYEMSKDEYVGIIKNVETYHKVNNEILNRWAHPVVLEHISVPSSLNINYKVMNMNIYTDYNVKIDSKSRLISSIALAKGCIIEENAEISNSIIGKETTIDQSCLIKNSIIYNSSIIKKNSKIINSIIGNKCTIDSDLTIIDCVIGDDVHLKVNQEGVRIYVNKELDDSECYDDEGSNEDNLVKVDNETFLRNLEDKDLLFVKQEDVNKDEEEDYEDEDSVEEEEEAEDEDYNGEIREVLINGLEKDNKIEDILQEISGLKNSYWEYSLSESILYIKFFSY